MLKFVGFFEKFLKQNGTVEQRISFFKKNTLTLALLVQVLVILIVLYSHHLLVYNYIAVFFHFKATADTSRKTLQAI